MIEKAVPQGGGFPLLLPSHSCQAAADPPAQGWGCQLGQVSEPQGKAVHRSPCAEEMQNQPLPVVYLALFIYLSLFICLQGLPICGDYKDVGIGQAWINGQCFQVVAGLWPELWS